MRGIFITGTDTDVGKTTVCAGILKLLYGSTALNYWKPVQTGTVVADDTIGLQQLTELPKEIFLDPAYRFPEPMSPHLAAKKWGKEVSLSEIDGKYKEYQKLNSFMVVEGAGGLMVPLNDRELQIDLMSMLGLPLIIITEDRLGAINQTLLTINAAREAKLEILGVILTKWRGALGNAESISHFGKVDILAEFAPSDDPKTTMAQVLSNSRLRGIFSLPNLPK